MDLTEFENAQFYRIIPLSKLENTISLPLTGFCYHKNVVHFNLKLQSYQEAIYIYIYVSDLILSYLELFHSLIEFKKKK